MPTPQCSKVPKVGEAAFKKEMLPHIWDRRGQTFLMENTNFPKAKLEDSFKLPPEVRSKLFDEFCKVDANDSGSLDPQEMSDLFSRLALNVSDQVWFV
jgi:hypothetical protein